MAVKALGAAYERMYYLTQVRYKFCIKFKNKKIKYNFCFNKCLNFLFKNIFTYLN